MSFGGASQGQVRYAVLVDATQAERSLNTLKSNMTSLQTPSTNLSRNMTSLNSTFNAGVRPIQNQGNALNQLGARQKTITSQLSTIGSAFKSNALAIGAAASSVLGLYQNYTNLAGAQNAANKSAIAAAAAQNKVEDMTRKLAAAQDKYGKNSKEALNIQKDLTIAQDRARQKVEAAKIAQDNLNQTMADFGINILPNILLAGGSITSIFDNISLKGKGLSGIVSKLGGVFSGIIPSLTGMGKSGVLTSSVLTSIGNNASITGGKLVGIKGPLGSIINSLTGISTGGPAAGAGMTAFAGGIDKASLSLKGSLALLGQVGALIAGFAAGGQIKQATKSLVESQQAFHDATISTFRALGLTEPQLKTLSETLSKVNEVLGQGKLEFHGLANEIKNVASPTNEVTKAQDHLNEVTKIYGPLAKSHVTTIANNAKAQIAAAQADLDRAKSQAVVTNNTIKLGEQIKILAGADKQLQTEWTLQTKAFEGSTKSINLASKAYLDVHNAIVTTNPAVTENITKTKEATAAQTQMDKALASLKARISIVGSTFLGAGDTIENIIAKFKALQNAVPKIPSTDVQKYDEALKNLGSGGITTVNKDLGALAQHTAESEAAFKSLGKTMKADLEKAAEDAKAAIDKMRGGVESGLDKIIEAFHKVHKKGKLDFEVNFDKAKKGFDKFLAEVGDKLDHGGAANAQKYVLAFEKKGTEKMSKSQARIFQPIFDWIEKHKNEPPDIFMSGFLQQLATYDPKVSQQFQKLIDPSIGLAGEIGKKAGKEFSVELMDAINSTLKIADRFKDLGAHPGRGSLKDTKAVKIPTEFIPPKTLPPAPKTPVKVPSLFNTPPPIPPPKTAVKVPAELVLQTNFNLAGLWESAGIKTPVKVPAVLGFGSPDPLSRRTKPGINEFTPHLVDQSNPSNDSVERRRLSALQGKHAGPNTDVSRSAFGISSGLGGSPKMSNTAPQINIEMALKQIDVLAKRIIGLSAIMPVLTLNNAAAIKAVDVIAVRLSTLSAIQPVITLVNNAAIKAIDVIAVRLSSLTNIQPVISLINNTAIKAVDVIAQRIMSLTGLQPSISLLNKIAIKAVDVVAKRIDDLTKIKPSISLQNKQAIKTVDVVAKRINSLENIKPSISLNNKNAIKAVDVVANRIQDLSNIHATVHVGLSGPGASLASKGDTSIASKADSSMFSKSNSGGDIIIENHNHIMDQDIVRRVTAAQGKNRYRFG